jgi:ABC-type phosphate transport system substrate-binding protein
MTHHIRRYGGAVLLVGLLFVTATNQARAQISVVVAASSQAQATESQIQDMFVGAATTWPDGTRVQVVDQPDTDVGTRFYADFLRQSVAQVRTQWTSKVLSGQASAPKKAADSDAVKRAVSETPGSIGYIATSALDDSVKELIRIP